MTITTTSRALKTLILAALFLGATRADAALSYKVINGNDSGPGSLRQAMLNANAHPGFVPGPGDTVAVIIYSDGMGTAPNSIQESIIEMKPMQSITNLATASARLAAFAACASTSDPAASNCRRDGCATTIFGNNFPSISVVSFRLIL